jgi:hypothetical protein
LLAGLGEIENTFFESLSSTPLTTGPNHLKIYPFLLAPNALTGLTIVAEKKNTPFPFGSIDSSI